MAEDQGCVWTRKLNDCQLSTRCGLLDPLFLNYWGCYLWSTIELFWLRTQNYKIEVRAKLNSKQLYSEGKAVPCFCETVLEWKYSNYGFGEFKEILPLLSGRASRCCCLYIQFKTTSHGPWHGHLKITSHRPRLGHIKTTSYRPRMATWMWRGSTPRPLQEGTHRDTLIL